LVRRPFALLALAAVAGAFLLAAPPARAAERVRVALLPIVVHSNDSREYLQQGLSDMLVSRLGRDTRLGVIKVEDPGKATTAIDKAREAGRAESAEFVVFGSFTRFGEGASLDLSVAKVAGDATARQIFAHSDSLGGIIPMLDGVAEKTALYVVEGAPSGPAVAAGPAGAASSSTAGGEGEVQELRRRVEALEHIVFTTNPVPTTKTPPVESTPDQNSPLKRTFPGDRQ
jgi:TolB-like protein